MERKRVIEVLHAGCGGEPLPEWISGPSFRETRLDINPGCNPDIVAPITVLGDIGPYDFVYCSHALEHCTYNGARTALFEFMRVLRKGGQVIIFVPDLEGISPTEDVIYQSKDAGPITGIDMIYGHRAMSANRPEMRHLTGFVQETLKDAMEKIGYTDVKVRRIEETFDLLASGKKP